MTSTRWSTAGLLRAWFIALVVAVAVFSAFPQLDLHVARIFYLGHNDFWIRGTPFAQFLDDVIRPGIRYAIIALVIWYLYWRFRGTPEQRRRNARCGFFLMSLLVATGLVVHVGFKDHWGRARPKQVTEFDGKWQYTPPLVPTNACQKNCSFVSGDVSAGVALLAFALYARRRQRFWVSVCVGVGLVFGLVRMMNGSHFLSDVIFAEIFTGGTILLMYRWFVEKQLRPDLTRLRTLFRPSGSAPN